MWATAADLADRQRKLKADVDPIIAPSAHRHGVGDDDIRHVYAHPIRAVPLRDDKVMLVGLDRAGQRMLEIGVVDTDRGDVVIHAMKAQAEYLPKLPRRRRNR